MCAARMPDPEVVIVGSGISGALIAKVLATAGRRVLIIEAGEQMPPDINGYMTRFLNASAKVPESPYPPDLFDSKGLVDPSTVNAGRPTVLSLGYRALDQKHEDGEFKWYVTPILGCRWCCSSSPCWSSCSSRPAARACS